MLGINLHNLKLNLFATFFKFPRRSLLLAAPATHTHTHIICGSCCFSWMNFGAISATRAHCCESIESWLNWKQLHWTSSILQSTWNQFWVLSEKRRAFNRRQQLRFGAHRVRLASWIQRTAILRVHHFPILTRRLPSPQREAKKKNFYKQLTRKSNY